MEYINPALVRFRLHQVMADRDIHLNKVLSQMSGIDETTIGRIKKNDAKMISLKNLDRLCKALNCQPGELFVSEPDAEDQAA